MTASNQPDPTTFQPGDLLWPKNPGAYVTYIVGGPGTYEGEEHQWERERSSFVANARQLTMLSPEQAEHAREVARMSFSEFRARYIGSGQGNRLSSGDGTETIDEYVSPGHVGVIFFNDSNPFVVEATPPNVRTISYEDWLAERPGDSVWHGRLRNENGPNRASIAAEACRHTHRSYDFWNLNLNDDSGFYCSKLVWLSVYRELSFALDDDPDPQRGIWYSPKQLMKSPHIVLLFNPGDYGSPG